MSLSWRSSPEQQLFFLSIFHKHPQSSSRHDFNLSNSHPSLSSFVRFDQQFFILRKCSSLARRRLKCQFCSFIPVCQGVLRCIDSELLLVSFKQIQIWMLFNIYSLAAHKKKEFRVSCVWLFSSNDTHTRRESRGKNAEKLSDQWILYGGARKKISHNCSFFVPVFSTLLMFLFFHIL